jgi:hypothetical protein
MAGHDRMVGTINKTHTVEAFFILPFVPSVQTSNPLSLVPLPLRSLAPRTTNRNYCTMSSVAGMLGLPPGVQFRPDDDELVEFYLLPRARGEPAPFPGVVVVDDDAAGSTLPWELLNRHGRGADDEAYFFVRSSGDGEGQEKPGARQERGCSGGGTWKSQKRLAHGGSRVDDAGEMVHWNRHNLNLHMGRGESGGSVGWVMHEYALTDPSCPPLKICHVAFTGHGKNRKRLPGGGDVDSQSEEPAPKRARVPSAGTGGSASSGSGSTTTTVDQDYCGVGHSSSEHQEPKQLSLEWISCQLLNDDLQSSSLPSSVDQDYCFQEFAQAAAPTTEQQVPDHVMMTPLPMIQQTAGIAKLQEFMAPMDQQEFMMPLPMVHETAGMTELQEFIAPMDQQEVMVPLLMVRETAGMAELQEFMAPMDQQEFMAPLPMVQETAVMAELQEFMASLPMVQETAGMAELENPYQPMMTQHEFMAPIMGVTLGQYCGLSRIGDMEAGAQQDFVEWEGILFY